jgi:hypothetical protein
MGNGAQVLYTFPFEYMDETDIWVGLWNDNSNRWEEIHDWLDLNVQPDIIAPYYWTFDNATTIRFLRTNPNSVPAVPINWAPPAPNNPTTEPTGANIIIQRRSDDNELVEFYPGSSIKAQDLNYNFDQLLYLIQEGRCIVPQWFLDYLDTIILTKDNLVTRPEQINCEAEISDEKVFTTAAGSARWDSYIRDAKPDPLPCEQPGKIWNDTDDLVDYFWDGENQVWVSFTKSGPPGPIGEFGPPGKVIVSDFPPTQYPAIGGNESRPLESGDLWFNSNLVMLYLYYVDNTGPQWVSVAKTGPPGPPGPSGSSGNLQEVTEDGNTTDVGMVVLDSNGNPVIELENTGFLQAIRLSINNNFAVEPNGIVRGVGFGITETGIASFASLENPGSSDLVTVNEFGDLQRGLDNLTTLP